MLCTVIAQCAWYVQQFCSLAIFEQMQISTAEMIAFTPAAHKVGSGQFGGFSLAEGLWLEFTEVHLMKFPVDLFASWIICFSSKSTVQTLSSVRAGSWVLKGDWLLFIYTKEKKNQVDLIGNIFKETIGTRTNHLMLIDHLHHSLETTRSLTCRDQLP